MSLVIIELRVLDHHNVVKSFRIYASCKEDEVQKKHY